jgi:hypothetical protein
MFEDDYESRAFEDDDLDEQMEFGEPLDEDDDEIAPELWQVQLIFLNSVVNVDHSFLLSFS